MSTQFVLSILYIYQSLQTGDVLLPTYDGNAYTCSYKLNCNMIGQFVHNCFSRWITLFDGHAGLWAQVFRALGVPLTCRDLSEILARLEQTVAESDENMQGYVTEILLTLEEAVDHLDVDIRPISKDIFMSTPNLNKESVAQVRKSATVTQARQFVTAPSASATQHMRSTSYNPGNLARKIVMPSPPVVEKGEVTRWWYLLEFALHWLCCDGNLAPTQCFFW